MKITFWSRLINIKALCLYYVNNNLGQIEKGTMFDGISYLGSASITYPKEKTEILRIMAILNGEHVADQDMKISVSIPNSSDGAVMYVV